MNHPRPPVGDILHSWTDAEREVWDAWSQVEQDVSQPETTLACSHVLDALEAANRQVVTTQSAVMRGMCGMCSDLATTLLLPDEGRVWIERACKPLLSISTLQHHLVAAWFGMARQVMVTGSGTRPPPK